MKPFTVLVGPRGAPRLNFSAMAPDSVAAAQQHLCLAEPGERVEVRAEANYRRALELQIAAQVRSEWRAS